MGRETEQAQEAPIHYFDVHAEAWRSTEYWPPVHDTKRFYLSAEQTLTQTPAEPSTNSFHVDFTATTGIQTRYERLGAASIVHYYPDWTDRSASMLTYETTALAHAMSIVGHPVATLLMSIDQGDASIFVYLSEVDTSGRVHYITEGMLRAIHRKISAAPDTYVTNWPFRTYHRADAARVEKGITTDYVIPLLPVAWTLAKGSKLRLSIAGADAGHFAPMPFGRPPVFTVHHGIGGSLIDVPVQPAETQPNLN